MKLWRILAVALATGFVVAVAPSCGPTQQCNASNCASGCCDADGQCQPGTAQAACGSAGGTCQTCPVGTACSVGICSPAGGGGGSDGGTNTDGGGNTGTTIALQNLCSQIGPAYCKYLVKCGLYQTEQGCMSDFGAQFGSDCLSDQLPAINDGRIAYHGDRAKRCIDFIANTATCDQFFGGTNDDCATLFEGKVATNGTCYEYDECVSGNRCSATSTTCPGQCVAVTYRNAGETLMGDDECAEGLYPYYVSGMGSVCQTPVAIGSSCAPLSGGFSDQQCVPGAYCDASNICQAQKTQGQPCSGVSNECGGFNECMNGTCQTGVALNGTCNTSTLDCRYDLYCDINPGTMVGSCKDRGVQGASCLEDGACERGFYCSGEVLTVNPPTPGVCTAVKAAGGTCTADGECVESAYCDNTGTCIAKKALGASCMASEECAEGSCNGGICTANGCTDPTP